MVPLSIFCRSCSSNKAVLFAETPDWKWRDWKAFLSRYFGAVPGIQKLQHFVFNKDKPGIVTVKQSAMGEPREVNILLCNPEDVPITNPCDLVPEGISRDRQQYLYRHVRPLVRESCKDKTCPAPSEE